MARVNPALVTFNRGRISSLMLARTDLDRVRLSAETQTNWIPRVLGSMMLRPGLEYIIGVHSERYTRLIPQVFSSTDRALLECTTTRYRIIVDDSVETRAAVNTSSTNGTFTSDSTGWTNADDSGASSTWVSGNYLGLKGTRYSWARRRQEVAVAATDSSAEHGIRVVVERGHPHIRIGSSLGADDYIRDTRLSRGEYSFSVTPSSNIHFELLANTAYQSLINSVQIETSSVGLSPSGVITMSAPWSTADLDNLRWTQPGSTTYIACGATLAPAKMERIGSTAGAKSWASLDYLPDDGPFRDINITDKRMTAYGRTGNITLECSEPLFSTGHVGALFRLVSIGQDSSGTFTGTNQFTDPIRVSGVDEGRIFDIVVTAASTAARVIIQRSVGEEGSWAAVAGLSYTATSSAQHDDGLDNQIIFYRIGVGSSYHTGTAAAKITYASGGRDGIVRIASVTSSTNASSTESSAIVLTPLGSTSATETWYEGAWSVERGFPSAVGLHEGRLYWAGQGHVWGSAPDAYETFDPTIVGDSKPINRSVGSGPVGSIRWILSLTRLVVGTDQRELQVKTSSLDEPLTPTTFSLRKITTQGSANVQAVEIDQRGLFIQQGGVRAMEIAPTAQTLDYGTQDKTMLVPEIGEPSIVKMAVQRQPDTRLHCIRGSTDGRAAILVTEPAENVTAWVDIETGDADGSNGVIEEVAVLPGAVEDEVYYVVKREINGSTVRYIERWAQESQARGGSSNTICDSFVWSTSTSLTFTGLDHLIGESVVAWGGTGRDLGEFTVAVSSAGSSRGQITLTEASTVGSAVGLPYTAWYKSAKLAYAAEGGSALTQTKRISHLGLVAKDMHQRALQFGPATSTDIYQLDYIPATKALETQSSDAVHTVYDEAGFSFPGTWDTDSRVVLRAVAPRPVTVLGVVMTIDERDKI